MTSLRMVAFCLSVSLILGESESIARNRFGLYFDACAAASGIDGAHELELSDGQIQRISDLDQKFVRDALDALPMAIRQAQLYKGNVDYFILKKKVKSDVRELNSRLLDDLRKVLSRKQFGRFKELFAQRLIRDRSFEALALVLDRPYTQVIQTAIKEEKDDPTDDEKEILQELNFLLFEEHLTKAQLKQVRRRMGVLADPIQINRRPNCELTKLFDDTKSRVAASNSTAVELRLSGEQLQELQAVRKKLARKTGNGDRAGLLRLSEERGFDFKKLEAFLGELSKESDKEIERILATKKSIVRLDELVMQSHVYNGHLFYVARILGINKPDNSFVDFESARAYAKEISRLKHSMKLAEHIADRNTLRRAVGKLTLPHVNYAVDDDPVRTIANRLLQNEVYTEDADSSDNPRRVNR